jgi:hypothetical protein
MFVSDTSTGILFLSFDRSHHFSLVAPSSNKTLFPLIKTVIDTGIQSDECLKGHCYCVPYW